MGARSDAFWISLCTEWVTFCEYVKKHWYEILFRSALLIFWILLLYLGGDAFNKANGMEDLKGMMAGQFFWLLG